MRKLVLALLGSMFAGSALAEDTVLQGEPEEVIVYGDPFARWDNTRWKVSQQMILPVPLKMVGLQNKEVWISSLQNEAVIECEKTWRKGKRFYEVACTLEEFAIRAVPRLAYEAVYTRPNVPEDAVERLQARTEKLNQILREWRDAFRTRDLTLKVGDDGRIVDVHIDEKRGGETEMEKTIRYKTIDLLKRMMAGFHMKLPRGTGISEGTQWLDYDSALFHLPGTTRGMSGGGVVHQLNSYRSKRVVQSVGTGLVDLTPVLVAWNKDAANGFDEPGYEELEDVPTMKAELNGVAIYDEASGYMVERVWSVSASPTASTSYNYVFSGLAYFHSGRLIELGEHGDANLAATMAVAPTDRWDFMAAWENID